MRSSSCARNSRAGTAGPPLHHPPTSILTMCSHRRKPCLNPTSSSRPPQPAGLGSRLRKVESRGLKGCPPNLWTTLWAAFLLSETFTAVSQRLQGMPVLQAVPQVADMESNQREFIEGVGTIDRVETHP